MFFKRFIGYHGYSTFVRGVWCLDEDGEKAVRITAVGREDDQFFVGQVICFDELAELVSDNADRYAAVA